MSLSCAGQFCSCFHSLSLSSSLCNYNWLWYIKQKSIDRTKLARRRCAGGGPLRSYGFHLQLLSFHRFLFSFLKFTCASSIENLAISLLATVHEEILNQNRVLMMWVKTGELRLAKMIAATSEREIKNIHKSRYMLNKIFCAPAFHDEICFYLFLQNMLT